MNTMRFVFLLLLFLWSDKTFCQNDTVDFDKLYALNGQEKISFFEVVIFGDYTYLSDNYKPEQTRFMYADNPFTGVGKKESSGEICYISFVNGMLDGRWYNRNIWNRDYITEGFYENGKKSGIWRSFYGSLQNDEGTYKEDQISGNTKFWFAQPNEWNINYRLNNEPLSDAIIRVTSYENQLPISERYLMNGKELNGELSVFQITDSSNLEISGIPVGSQLHWCDYTFHQGEMVGCKRYCDDGKRIYQHISLLEPGKIKVVQESCENRYPAQEGVYKIKGFVQTPWSVEIDHLDTVIYEQEN
jgi:antitoxin component YwqK of YwqJK toxin-antitoxin module